MNDKALNEQKRRLKLLADRWVGPLGLKWWKIDFVYVREGLDLGDHIKDTGTETCLAKTHVHWQYLNALVEWNMPQVAEQDDEELEKAFVHELMHIFVQEMREWGEDEMPAGKVSDAVRHEERVVCQLTNAMLWLRQHAHEEGQRDAKKKRAAPKRALRR